MLVAVVVVLAEGGGVQVGLMGMGGVVAVVTVGGVVVVEGVFMVMQPDNVLIASKMTSMREVNKSLRFIFFMAVYITVYYSIIKILLRNVNPLPVLWRGGF